MHRHYRAPLLRNLMFGPDRANSSISLSPPQGGDKAEVLTCIWILGSSPRMTEYGERRVSSSTASIAQRLRRMPSSTPRRSSSSGLTRGSRRKPSETRRPRQTGPFSRIRGTPSRNPPTKSTPQLFFIPHHFHPRRLIPVPRWDTPDDAMSGEAGPAPGGRTVAGPSSRPAATVSLRTRGWNEGDGVGCLFTGYPDRKDVPQRHTDKAPTPSRTTRRRGG